MPREIRDDFHDILDEGAFPDITLEIRSGWCREILDTRPGVLAGVGVVVDLDRLAGGHMRLLHREAPLLWAEDEALARVRVDDALYERYREAWDLAVGLASRARQIRRGCFGLAHCPGRFNISTPAFHEYRERVMAEARDVDGVP